jgi:flagellar biosynthesis protein FlhA
LDPAFGLPAKWIAMSQRHRAELKGFTIVDPPTVLITHLGEVLTRFAPELFSREDMRQLLDKVRESSPTVIEELKPDLIRMGELHQVLVMLLQERVPLTNLTRILEVIVQVAPHVKDPALIADRIREQLGRDILDRLRDESGHVKVAVLDPRLEMRLREMIRDSQLQIPHAPLEKLVAALHECWQKCSLASAEITLLTDGTLRRPLRRTIERSVPDLSVTAYSEIPADLTIDFEHIIRLEDIFPELANQPEQQSDNRSPGRATASAEHYQAVPLDAA